jgi:hypothetical protein
MPEWEDPPEQPKSCLSRAKAECLSLKEQQRAEEEWPVSTRLVIDGKKLKLMVQLPTIRTLLNKTFILTQAELTFTNPFPNSHEQDEIIKKVMKRLVVTQGDPYKEIHWHLGKDPSYASALTIPVGSTSLICYAD